MYYVIIIAMQDALRAIETLRDDPLLYPLIALPMLGILGMGWLYRRKEQELVKEREAHRVDMAALRSENKALNESIIQVNTLATEAIVSQVEVMRNMRVDQKEALTEYRKHIADISAQIAGVNTARGTR